MKKSLLLILTLAISTFAVQCVREECCIAPIECQPNSTLSGTWQLEYFENLATGEIERNPDPSRKVVYTFKDNRSEGKIEGHTFVNTVGGGYKIGADCSYEIIGFGGSKVGEPEWSRKAWLQENSGTYSVSDMVLALTPGNASERIVFKKVKD